MDFFIISDSQLNKLLRKIAFSTTCERLQKKPSQTIFQQICEGYQKAPKRFFDLNLSGAFI